jgi:3'-phosphoadenosine 5'-phosphosulfate sulfotransferase (PAPS reductase)/FAD synthetase
MNLRDYDFIFANSSGGKDSQAQLDVLATLAREQGVLDRLHVVHCAFPEEWEGTEELAREQALHYVPAERFHIVRNLTPSTRGTGSLLERVKDRGSWPGRDSRYCTSEFKTSPGDKLIRHLTKDRSRNWRVLKCLGIRAAESPARAKKPAFLSSHRSNTSFRRIDTWLPIFDWSVEKVWATIKASGVRHHPAYDQGLPRLSCVFCVFGSKGALQKAGRLNPDLLNRYVEVEKEIDHSFTKLNSIASVKQWIDTHDESEDAPIGTWET